MPETLLLPQDKEAIERRARQGVSPADIVHEFHYLIVQAEVEFLAWEDEFYHTCTEQEEVEGGCSCMHFYVEHAGPEPYQTEWGPDTNVIWFTAQRARIK